MAGIVRNLIVLGLIGFGIFLIARGWSSQPRASEISTSSQSQPEPAATSEPTSTVSAVPILMYHYIRDYNDPRDKIGINLSVAPQTFARQLDHLTKQGYTTATLDDFTQHRLKEKSVILTFDDGYASHYTDAFPALKARGMTATFYIVTNAVGTNGSLTWDQIREMQGAGMQIESHGPSHRDLTTLSKEEQLNELVESKKTIEGKLGKTVQHFCYPSGRYTEDTLALVKSAGYETATTTKSGVASYTHSPYELPRLRIENITDFSAILP